MALILVVDDEPHIVKMVEFKLRNQGYETISAADGNQALEMALTRKNLTKVTATGSIADLISLTGIDIKLNGVIK